jgi:hypothetical protein
MANETWEEARMLILDKLAYHTKELTNISKELNTFKSSFSIGMTELKTKIMIGTSIVSIVFGSITAAIVGKILG